MPNIPIIEQSVGAAFTPNSAKATGDTFGANIGRAVSAAGAEIAKVNAQLEKKRVNDEKLRAEKFLAEFHQQELITLNDTKENTENPVGFADTYTQDRDGRFASALKQQGFSDDIQKYVGLGYAKTIQTSTLTNALNYEHTASADQTKRLWNEIVDDHANIARIDPGALVGKLDTIDQLIEQQDIPPALREPFAQFYRNKVVYSAARGKMDAVTSSGEAADLIDEFREKGGVWEQNLGSEAYERLLSLAESNQADALRQEAKIKAERDRQMSLDMAQEFSALNMKGRAGDLSEVELAEFQRKFWDISGGAAYVDRLNNIFYDREGTSKAAKKEMVQDYVRIRQDILRDKATEDDIGAFEDMYFDMDGGASYTLQLDTAFMSAKGSGGGDQSASPMETDHANIDVAIAQADEASRAELEAAVGEFKVRYGAEKGGPAKWATLHKRLLARFDGEDSGKLSEKDLLALAMQNRADPFAFPLDPTNSDHVDAVDAHWKNIEQPQIDQIPEDTPFAEQTDIINGLVANAVGPAGIVPPAMRSELVKALQSNEPALNVKGALMLRAINTSAPRASLDLKQKYLKYGMDLSTLMDRGYTPDQAVEAAREMGQKTEDDRKSLGTMFSNEISKDIDWELVQEDVLGRPDLLWLIDQDVELPTEAKSNFLSLYRDEFIRTGDQATAYTNAGRIFQQKWTVSEIHNPDGEWTFQPPEQFYGVPHADNVEWIKEQAVQDVLSASLYPEDSDFPEMLRDNPIRFVPVPNRLSPEGKPVYQLFSHNGREWVDLNVPFWTPDYNATKDAQAKVKRAAEYRKKMQESMNDPAWIERDTRLYPTGGL